MSANDLTRRRLLELGLALPPVAALAGGLDLLAGEAAAGTRLRATPTIADADEPTPALTEGPYSPPAPPCAARSCRRGRPARASA